MANRFWVGGAGTWDNASTAHWSTASGGASGASIPGSSDTAIFDANSGSGSVLVAAAAPSINGWNTTGFTGAFTHAGAAVLDIKGVATVILNAGANWSGFLGTLQFSGTSGTLTSNGASLACDVVVTSGAVLTLGSALTTTGDINVSGAGSGFNTSASNYNVTANSYAVSTSSDTTFNSSTITLTGTATPLSYNGSGAMNAGAATFNLTGGSGTFAGGGKNYGTVNFTAAAVGIYTITGSNTFGTLNCPAPAGARTLRLTAGTTTTITTAFTATGYDSNNRFTLKSATNAQHTISKTAGNVTLDWADLSYSIATGGASFSASNSVDSGNNTGWVISSSGDTLFFGTPF